MLKALNLLLAITTAVRMRSLTSFVMDEPEDPVWLPKGSKRDEVKALSVKLYSSNLARIYTFVLPSCCLERKWWYFFQVFPIILLISFSEISFIEVLAPAAGEVIFSCLWCSFCSILSATLSANLI